MNTRLTQLTFFIFLCICLNQNVYAQLKAEKGITYYSHVKPIIDNHCLTCHSEVNPAEDIPLTTYVDVRFLAEKSNLIHRVNDANDPMPPSGLISKQERDIIDAWAANDFKMGRKDYTKNEQAEYTFIPPQINPVEVDLEIFDFFEQIHGHWIGEIEILGQQLPWFAYDFRPISASHVHAIYEGGTMGNIFTSFFVADYKGTKTIMVRNGGILNGIYRTSYFVLEEYDNRRDKQSYRFVDAYGGKKIMWIDIVFSNNTLEFNSYTSRFGSRGKPTVHQRFKASKRQTEISNQVAKELKYPSIQVEFDFSEGMPQPNWGSEYPVVTSASYMNQRPNKTLLELGKLANDPITIDDMPHLASLSISIQQKEKIKNHDLIIYLSKKPLTNQDGSIKLEYGYVSEAAFNSVVAFPNLKAKTSEFTFHYLHPGEYYVTVVADKNKDGFISRGDKTSASKLIIVPSQQHSTVQPIDILFQN